jgi:hypothetical protein
MSVDASVARSRSLVTVLTCVALGTLVTRSEHALPRQHKPQQQSAAPVSAASSTVHASIAPPWDSSVADGCRHVYLDLGSNVGVQVRKLFEPELYPRSAPQSIAVYDSHFGPGAARRGTTCAFGFEINSLHVPRLRAIEDAYSRRGWRTRFFTQTGVGADFAWVQSATAPPAFENDLQTGNSLSFGAAPAAAEDSVLIVDIAEFVRAVRGRKLPPDLENGDGSGGGGTGGGSNEGSGEGGKAVARAPSIVAKMDIEGFEFLVLPHLLRTGMLCALDFVFIDSHPGTPTTLLSLCRNALKSAGCRTELSLLDDEEYADSFFPLPA